MGIATSPNGRFVLVTRASSDGVVVFARDAETGELTFAQVELDGVDGADGLDSPARVAISPDGSHTLVTGRGTDDALALFAPEPGAAGGLLAAIAVLGWLGRLRA